VTLFAQRETLSLYAGGTPSNTACNGPLSSVFFFSNARIPYADPQSSA
jgi:hypothetical protein